MTPLSGPSRQSERGAALLTVLLLVAMMSVIAATMLDRVSLATRLAANGQALTQARFYALAAETLVMERVSNLVQMDNARTVDRQGLLGREFEIPFDQGLATVRVEDAGNCFNVNSLVVGQEDSFQARPVGSNQFLALMAALEVPQGNAQMIAESATDWIDTDGVPTASGAEDSYYLGLATPYRTPNRLVGDVSELRAVRGMTVEIYDRIKPWICALPFPELSPINVNTLRPEQALLLHILAPQQIDMERVRSLLAQRPEQGFGSTVEFWRPFALDSRIVGPRVEQQVGLRSRWFAIHIRTRIGETELVEEAVMDSRLEPARLVYRFWGEDL